MTGRKTWVLFGSLLLLGTMMAIAGTHRGWFKGNDKPTADLPDARAEYKKICERFLIKDTLLNLAGEVRLFDHDDSLNVKEMLTFEMMQDTRSYYVRFGQVQTFFDGRLSVQLDTVNKYVAVAQADRKKLSGNIDVKSAINLLFDDTASMQIAVEVDNSGERYLKIEGLGNPGIRSYKVYYDAQSYRLRSATIEWWKDMTVAAESDRQVWTTKLSYQYLPATALDIDASIQDILSVDGKKIGLKEYYKDYQLHIATPQ